MPRFEPLTESLCDQLCQEATDLLSPLADKYEICLDFVKEKCSEDASSVAINARFSLPERPESVASLKEEQDFRQYAEGYGMSVDWLGKEFQRGNFTYKVAGLQVNASRKCVVLQRTDGVRCQEEGKLIARYLG